MGRLIAGVTRFVQRLHAQDSIFCLLRRGDELPHSKQIFNKEHG